MSIPLKKASQMSRADKISEAISSLTPGRISKLLSKDIDENDKRYLTQYEFISTHFTSLGKELTYHDYVIGSHIVYAWMPTVLRFKIHKNNADKKKVTNTIAKASRENQNAKTQRSANELELLASPFGGSLVAPSKFLHFLNPDAWPIWDRRVYRGIMKLNGQETAAHHYEMQNVDIYIAYVNKLRSLANTDQHFGEDSIIPELKKVTNIRCLELGLFIAGQK